MFQFVFVTFLFLNFSQAQNLSAEEQRQMLEEMKSMKERLNKLENKPSSGLKTVNYENETAEKKTGTQDPASASPTLSSEQTKKLMEDVKALQMKQIESQKMLDELEKEEQQ